MTGFLKIVKADIWDIPCDTVSLPTNSSFDFCANVLERAGPVLEQEMTEIRRHYKKISHLHSTKYNPPHLATSLNGKVKIMLTFYGPISDPTKPTDSELFNVRQAFKQVLSVVRRKGYSSIAIAVPYSDNAAAKHSSIMTEIIHAIIDKINETDLKDVYFVVPIKDTVIASNIAGLIGGYNVWLNSSDVLKKIFKRLAPPSSTIMSSTNKQISKLTSLVKKTYQCHMCKKAYPSQCNLNRHLRDKHGVEVDLEGVRPVITNSNVIDSSKDEKRSKITSVNYVCYFSIPHNKLMRANGYVLKCTTDKDPIRMGDINATVELYDASHVLDLLFLRGTGEQIDWAQDSEKSRILESFVCANHLNELLLKWDGYQVFNKKRRVKGEPICSLPNVIHDGGERGKIPSSFRKLNKIEAVRFMNATNVLCHVGSAVCKKHYAAVDQNRMVDILFGEQFNDNPMRSDEEGSDYVPSVVPSRDQSIESNHDNSNNPEQERTQKVQALCEAFGINRLTSKEKWSDLKENVQEKKINAMLRLFNGICNVAAGEDWMEFRKLCLTKIGCTVQDSRVEEIMSTISSALENCSLEVLSNILAALPTIFDNPNWQQREDLLLKNFHRVRLDRGILKDFVAFLALPDVTMCMPSAGRSFKLESGDTVELAKVIRVFSFREIYRMYLRYSEKMALDDRKTTEADVKEFVNKHSLGFTTAYKLMEVLVPIRRKRLQCIDNYQADSIEAFDYLNGYINELCATHPKIDSSTRSDLLRRSRVSSNFISYEQRVHMDKESDIINHCLRHLLSFSKIFASPCNLAPRARSHKSCTDVFDVFLAILQKAHDECMDKNEKAERIRIARMMEQMEMSKHNVLEYRKHQIRAFASALGKQGKPLCAVSAGLEMQVIKEHTELFCKIFFVV